MLNKQTNTLAAMKYTLTQLNVNALSHNQAETLVYDILRDSKQSPEIPITDKRIHVYLNLLQEKMSRFTAGIMQKRKNLNTEKVLKANEERNVAFRALSKAIKLYALSDVETEREAAHSLLHVLQSHKGLLRQEALAKSSQINTLIGRLTDEEHQPHSEVIFLGRYISRLEAANMKFGKVFTARSCEIALTEKIETVAMRKELFACYREFTLYVLAMANATNESEYVELLQLINHSRHNSAVTLAKRKGRINKKKALAELNDGQSEVKN